MKDEVPLTGYRFIDIKALVGLLNIVGFCPKCGSKLKLCQVAKQGLSFKMEVSCKKNNKPDCKFIYSF